MGLVMVNITPALFVCVFVCEALRVGLSIGGCADHLLGKPSSGNALALM